MRTLLTALCRLLLRIFFRRIDMVHAERVPADDSAPVMYVLNHPNALLDPLFILCMSPRPVTFLAKAPLFSTFLVKHFVRAFECLPVYRAKDGDDPSKNRASIEASIALLGSGKALALFPEGVSHSKPRLEPLKTGAARIALSASANPNPNPNDASSEAGPAARAVSIVPVGLYYDDKTTFRSGAALVFGQPLTTPRVTLDGRSRPPEHVAEQLTAEIAAALSEVTVQAHTHEALQLGRALARILVADGGGKPAVADVELERRIVDGYERLREREPLLVQRTLGRVRRFEDQLARLGLPVDHPARLDRRRATRWTIVRVLALALLLAPALLGIATHLLPYRLVDVLAHSVARRHAVDDDGADVLATLKLIAGFLLFPLTWAAVAVAVGVAMRPQGLLAGALALVVVPACGWAALRFVELLADFLERARGAWRLVTHRDLGAFVRAEREAIRAEVTALADALARADGPAPASGS